MEHTSEFLEEDEVVRITGYQIPSKQIAWLANNGWQYTLTRARRPVVGRVYARLKMAGVKPNVTNATAETWTLDLSRVG
jgi:hypothetical protein